MDACSGGKGEKKLSAMCLKKSLVEVIQVMVEVMFKLFLVKLKLKLSILCCNFLTLTEITLTNSS